MLSPTTRHTVDTGGLLVIYVLHSLSQSRIHLINNVQSHCLIPLSLAPCPFFALLQHVMRLIFQGSKPKCNLPTHIPWKTITFRIPFKHNTFSTTSSLFRKLLQQYLYIYPLSALLNYHILSLLLIRCHVVQGAGETL